MGYSFTNKISEEKHRVLKELYIEYGKQMLQVAKSILFDDYLAEDAVHTAFDNLERKKFKIDSISCNKTKIFMVIIVRHVAIENYNSKRIENLSYENNEISKIKDEHPLPLDIIISNESIDEILNYIDELDNKYSDVLTMKYISDYTSKEIAAFLDISEQLVRVRLHRAKKMLCEKIDKGKQING